MFSSLGDTTEKFLHKIRPIFQGIPQKHYFTLKFSLWSHKHKKPYFVITLYSKSNSQSNATLFTAHLYVSTYMLEYGFMVTVMI